MDDESIVGHLNNIPELPAVTYPVAPSTVNNYHINTIKLTSVPFACWLLHDICFDFDHAIVRPDAKPVFFQLAQIWGHEFFRYKSPKITLFGHADPIGSEKYNKQLSENRAKAVYAVLTRQADIILDLCDSVEAIKTLQFFMRQEGLYLGDIDGKKDELAEPVKKYMDVLCPDLELCDEDFLASGKILYQGCSEFNPILMFSRKQQKELSKKKNIVERNYENQSNRRVIGYIWHADEEIDPALWPCKSDHEHCKKYFWHKEEVKQRLSFQKDGRQWCKKESDSQTKSGRWTYKHSTRMFACLHYEHISKISPCEIARKGDGLRVAFEGPALFLWKILEMHEINNCNSTDNCKVYEYSEEEINGIYKEQVSQSYHAKLSPKKRAQYERTRSITFEQFLRESRSLITLLVSTSLEKTAHGKMASYHLTATVTYQPTGEVLFSESVHATVLLGFNYFYYFPQKKSLQSKSMRFFSLKKNEDPPPGAKIMKSPIGLDEKIDELYKKLSTIGFNDLYQINENSKNYKRFPSICNRAIMKLHEMRARK